MVSIVLFTPCLYAGRPGLGREFIHDCARATPPSRSVLSNPANPAPESMRRLAALMKARSSDGEESEMPFQTNNLQRSLRRRQTRPPSRPAAA